MFLQELEKGKEGGSLRNDKKEGGKYVYHLKIVLRK